MVNSIIMEVINEFCKYFSTPYNIKTLARNKRLDNPLFKDEKLNAQVVVLSLLEFQDNSLFY